MAGLWRTRSRFVLEVAQAVADAIGADRVGIRLSPAMPLGGIDEGGTESVRAQYRHLVGELASLNLAYLHLHHVGDDELLRSFRDVWPTAVLVVRYGRTREQIADDIDAGLADIAPLGRFALAVHPPIRPHRPVRRSNNGKSLNMPTLNGATVLVTGANGGIGTQFVHEALARGAAKVYATARTPKTWDDKRIVPLTLDVTDPSSILAAAEAAPDVTVLINNAGASVSSPGILTQTDEEIRANVETNFLGPLFLTRAFAPILSAKDESVIIDIHSALSWYAVSGIYSATKAALWSATNSLRLELAPAGVHVGYVDTAMAAHATSPKLDPAVLVRTVFDATEAGEFEVLADEASVKLKAGLSAPIEAVYPQLAATNA